MQELARSIDRRIEADRTEDQPSTEFDEVAGLKALLARRPLMHDEDFPYPPGPANDVNLFNDGEIYLRLKLGHFVLISRDAAERIIQRLEDQ